MDDTKCTEVLRGGNIDPSVQSSRHRAFCFTSYSESAIIFNNTDMRYLLYAPETCPTTNRKHWQGYIVFKSAKTLSSASKHLGCSVFIAKGNITHQLNYIKGPYNEDGKTKPYNPDWKEFGERPKQGKRNDLDEIKDELLNDELTINELILERPILYHQYGRTLDKIEDLKMRQKFRTKMTECIWYYGPTGVGKSHKAFENYHPDTHYVVPKDNGWWDKYTQQRIVILNDFRGEITYNELLQMIDKWPFDVKRRGREPMPFTSELVIITSSLPPEKVYWHRDEEDKIEQLLRRVKVIKLDEKNKSPPSD